MFNDLKIGKLRFESFIKSLGLDNYKQRVIVTMFIVLASFSVLFGRLFYLQIIQGKNYHRLSEINSIRLEDVAPTRGLILDRHGKLMVDNRPSFELSIVLKHVTDVGKTIGNLSRFIGIPVEELLARIESQKGGPRHKSILLKQDIGRDAVGAIEAHKYDLPGIQVQVKPIRHYIEKERAAHLIGYLSEISADELELEKYRENRAGDFIGKVGIEKQFESHLKGKRGGRQVEVNAVGQVVRVLKTVSAVPGHNIFLTIDEPLQRTAEQLLAGKAGAVVAMVPQTGEVLVMASSPGFDPNAFVCGMTHEYWQGLISNPFRPLENKAINAEYPPASVYKIVTAMAGWEEGIITDDFEMTCTGRYPFGNRTFRCWKKWGHGKVEFEKAMARSCDVYFYEVGHLLGVDRLAWYASGCGLGGATGIDVENESKGLVPTAAWKKRRFNESWQKGETLSIAIGQGYNLVTAMQAVVLAAGVANNGQMMKPQILQEIKSAEENVIFKSTPHLTGHLPASPETLAKIKKGLFRVVQDSIGTAYAARIKGIHMSGKTGTAQVVGRKDDEEVVDEEGIPHHMKDHAWFVAYAPSEDPQIAVSVIVEHGEHGSSAAAPIARDVIKQYLAISPEADSPVGPLARLPVGPLAP